MGQKDVSYLLFDIGNTSFHIYYSKNSNLYTIRGEDNLKELFLKEKFEKESLIYISYVNTIKLNQLIKLLNQNEFKNYTIIDSSKLDKKIKELGYQIDNLDVLGEDMLFDVLGVDSTCLVVDYGTASKLILLDENKKLVGGSIGPGLRLINRSLDVSTEKLETFKVDVPPYLFSLRTDEAINSNTTYGEAFKIIGYYNKCKQDYPLLKLIISGGDGKIIKASLNKLNFYEFEFDELIIFKGISKVFDLNIDFRKYEGK